MTVRTEFPQEVEIIEQAWIELSDGTRLAARIWMPDDARTNPVPAILEYLPYRLTDGTTERDTLQHIYFAGHGYASVRVDMRGSGNSTGIMYDEYLKQEQDDALEILEWLEEQPWCDGNVGMIGISWGGFNGLQIAARRPPQLKAVISLCSTDDRYADDVHYVGGCLNGTDQLAWASTMLLYNAKPPLPWVVGDGWREIWLDCIDRTPPWIDAWMTHQRRDEFWQHGSICENYAVIECPVFAVGGWSDGYTNAIMRMLENLPGPSKGLIGPWAHSYPDFALPGPRIGFLKECLRWWDHWLKGIDRGVEHDPKLRAWMPDALEPASHYEIWPGRWIAEPEWPSPSIELAEFFPNADGSLAEAPASTESINIAGSLLHGKYAGLWCPYGIPGDFPSDQRQEDALCLTFESEPMAERTEILGYPELRVRLSADKPQALLAVRLCDIWPGPEGAPRSTLITRGLLNLSHRDSHEHPEPSEPGREYDVTIRLNATAWSLPAGHRLRLAISPTYWPWAWPSSESATLTAELGESTRLSVPVRPNSGRQCEAQFEGSETGAPEPVEHITPGDRNWEISYDPVSGRQSITMEDSQAKRLIDQDLTLRTASRADWSVRNGDPLSASNVVENSWRATRGEWDARVQTRSTLTADATHFHLTTLVEAFEGDVRVRTKSHSAAIPRDNV